MITRRKLASLVAATMLVLASMAGLASSADAEVSPEEFNLGGQYLEFTTKNQTIRFEGTVWPHLYLREGSADKVRMKVTGELIHNAPGCARLKVEYLDAFGAVFGTDYSPSFEREAGEPTVHRQISELSFHPHYREVRLRIQYKSGCQGSWGTVATTTSSLDLDGDHFTNPLGVDGVTVKGIQSHYPFDMQHTIPWSLNAGYAEDVRLTWDALANHYVDDEARANVTAKIAFSNPLPLAPGCVRLRMDGRDNQNDVLETAYSNWVCSKSPTKVDVSLDPHQELDHVRIRLYVRPDGGSSSASASEYRELG